MLRASEMAEYGNIAVNGIPHVRPDGTFFYTAFEEGLGTGENIIYFIVNYRKGKIYAAADSRDFNSPANIAKAFFALWSNSPGHRANMLNPDFKTMNLGVQVNESGKGVEPVYPKAPGRYTMIGVQIFSSYTDDEIIELKKNGPIEIEGIYFE